MESDNFDWEQQVQPKYFMILSLKKLVNSVAFTKNLWLLWTKLHFFPLVGKIYSQPPVSDHLFVVVHCVLPPVGCCSFKGINFILLFLTKLTHPQPPLLTLLPWTAITSPLFRGQTQTLLEDKWLSDLATTRLRTSWMWVLSQETSGRLLEMTSCCRNAASPVGGLAPPCFSKSKFSPSPSV